MIPMVDFAVDCSIPELEVRPISSFNREIMGILRDIYASTRTEELALTDWNHEQKEAFIDHQFHAQHDYYQKVYSSASYQMIHIRGAAGGRLYLMDWAEDLRIIDITLLPQYRNQGYGTGILQSLQKYCMHHTKSLSIHVEQFNPAKKLYERLGFVQVESFDEVYVLMKWRHTRPE